MANKMLDFPQMEESRDFEEDDSIWSQTTDDLDKEQSTKKPEKIDGADKNNQTGGSVKTNGADKNNKTVGSVKTDGPDKTEEEVSAQKKRGRPSGTTKEKTDEEIEEEKIRKKLRNAEYNKRRQQNKEKNRLAAMGLLFEPEVPTSAKSAKKPPASSSATASKVPTKASATKTAPPSASATKRKVPSSTAQTMPHVNQPMVSTAPAAVASHEPMYPNAADFFPDIHVQPYEPPILDLLGNDPAIRVLTDNTQSTLMKTDVMDGRLIKIEKQLEAIKLKSDDIEDAQKEVYVKIDMGQESIVKEVLEMKAKYQENEVTMKSIQDGQNQILKLMQLKQSHQMTGKSPHHPSSASPAHHGPSSPRGSNSSHAVYSSRGSTSKSPGEMYGYNTEKSYKRVTETPQPTGYADHAGTPKVYPQSKLYYEKSASSYSSPQQVYESSGKVGGEGYYKTKGDQYVRDGRHSTEMHHVGNERQTREDRDRYTREDRDRDTREDRVWHSRLGKARDGDGKSLDDKYKSRR